MAKAEDISTRVANPIANQERLPDSDTPFASIPEGIEKIAYLEDQTFDLFGLTKCIAAIWSKIEHSKGLKPDDGFVRMIDPSDVESLTYLVERTRDISEDLNSKFHNYVQRLSQTPTLIS